MLSPFNEDINYEDLIAQKLTGVPDQDQREHETRLVGCLSDWPENEPQVHSESARWCRQSVHNW